MLKEEVKNETRENIADLFDAEDVVRTRVVRTMSFRFTVQYSTMVYMMLGSDTWRSELKIYPVGLNYENLELANLVSLSL